MGDEHGLLAAVRAAPADSLPRLVYADWLDEQADPRHELVRACERMRRVPVFSDEYWRLKARRDELRPTCPAGWLADLGYDGSRYDPVFRDGIPAGWRERWRLTREFTERWHGVPMPDVGGRRDEIAEVERRLGRSLPPSVRECYAFRLDVSPEEKAALVERFSIKTLASNGGPAHLLPTPADHLAWAVLAEHLELDDPPVYNLGVDAEMFAGGWGRSFPSVSVYALYHAIRSPPGPGGSFTAVYDDPGLGGRLSRQLPIAFRCRDGFVEGDDIWGVVVNAATYSRGQVTVYVRRRLAPDRIPRVLWDLARQATERSGVFAEEEPRPLPPVTR